MIRDSKDLFKEFSFGIQLQKALLKNKPHQSLSEMPKNHPKIQEHNLEAFDFSNKCDLMSLLEFQERLFYFLICNNKVQNSFKLQIKTFKKEDGSHMDLYIQIFKGLASCLEVGVLGYKDDDQQSKGENEEMRYNVALLIGTKDGNIKTIIFDCNAKSRIYVSTIKIQQKPIIQILIPRDRQKFYQKNICLILIQDSKFITYNFYSKIVVAIHRPPIISCDLALGIDLHFTSKVIATFTHLGQIVLWQVEDEYLRQIQMSQTVEKKKQQNFSHRVSSKEFQNEKKFVFNCKNRYISLFPIYTLHSPCIQGLKWGSFYGNCLILITKSGILKIIAINLEYSDEYLLLLQYKIENGEAINEVKLYSNEQCIIVVKGKKYQLTYNQMDQQSDKQERLKTKEKLLKQNDYKSRMNFSCKQSRYLKNQECCVQMIKFGGSLLVEHIIRNYFVKNGHYVGIQSALISQNREFIFAKTGDKICITKAQNLVQMNE